MFPRIAGIPRSKLSSCLSFPRIWNFRQTLLLQADFVSFTERYFQMNYQILFINLQYNVLYFITIESSLTNNEEIFFLKQTIMTLDTLGAKLNKINT